MVKPDWIEVCYALLDRQHLVRQNFVPMTAEQAIERCGLLREFPEIDLAENPVGIFGERVRLSHRLKPGDRV